jgi:hypothetical protein
LLRRFLDTHPVAFQGSDARSNMVTPCPANDDLRDVSAARTNVEQAESLQFVRLNQPRQPAKHVTVAAEIAIDQT